MKLTEEAQSRMTVPKGRVLGLGGISLASVSFFCFEICYTVGECS
jgi:hypothetical protein